MIHCLGELLVLLTVAAAGPSSLGGSAGQVARGAPLIGTFRYSEPVHCVVLSPDSHRLAVATPLGCAARAGSGLSRETPRRVYRDGVGHWLRDLHIEKQEYVLKCFRLPEEVGQIRKSNAGWRLVPSDGSKSRIPELVFIEWGGRAYLVEPERLIAFCNAVNHGEEPRKSSGGLFLLRDGELLRVERP